MSVCLIYKCVKIKERSVILGQYKFKQESLFYFLILIFCVIVYIVIYVILGKFSMRNLEKFEIQNFIVGFELEWYQKKIRKR